VLLSVAIKSDIKYTILLVSSLHCHMFRNHTSLLDPSRWGWARAQASAPPPMDFKEKRKYEEKKDVYQMLVM
jgi:hypothetical protein